MARKKTVPDEEEKRDDMTPAEPLTELGEQPAGEDEDATLLLSAPTPDDDPFTEPVAEDSAIGEGELSVQETPPEDSDTAGSMELKNSMDEAEAPSTQPEIEGLGLESVQLSGEESSTEANDAEAALRADWLGTDAQPEGEEEESAEDEEPVSFQDVEEPSEEVKSEWQKFVELDFHELDRGLTAEERKEWNAIYASFRGRSSLSGAIVGVDPHKAVVRDPRTGESRTEEMYCAVVIPYRVPIIIPAKEMWEPGKERPDFVFRNMVGAKIDFIVTKVDREGGFAVASRKLALRARRYYFSRRPRLNHEGARIQCQMLAVGPRRCLVECYGHDIEMTQRDIRYTAIPDLRDDYHPGVVLDCIVKNFDAEKNALTISVKETECNPFDGASLRNPVGCRRQAVISGKYGGGVFCNLPDDTVCMCNYSFQHDDADFNVGDTVILVIQRYENAKKQIYGKIISKW